MLVTGVIGKGPKIFLFSVQTCMTLMDGYECVQSVLSVWKELKS